MTVNSAAADLCFNLFLVGTKKLPHDGKRIPYRQGAREKIVGLVDSSFGISLTEDVLGEQ